MLSPNQLDSLWDFSLALYAQPEVADTCLRLQDEQGINVWELIHMANRHPRVNILTPGAGVGGHCIAVDPWFIVHSAPEQARLIRTAREVNDFKPEWVLQKVMTTVANHPLNKPSVACFGLAFKPDIDDLRESPALHIVNKLADTYEGKVLAVEPNVESTNKLNSKAQLVSLEQGLAADIIVILVKHKAFANCDFSGKTVINVVGQ